MKSMLMQSDFLTFLPRELIYWELQAGQLTTLALSGPSWTRTVGITRRARGSLNVAGKVLVEALKEVAGTFS
jgi:DNA-binding transcriptional LysR family regulator